MAHRSTYTHPPRPLPPPSTLHSPPCTQTNKRLPLPLKLMRTHVKNATLVNLVLQDERSCRFEIHGDAEAPACKCRGIWGYFKGYLRSGSCRNLRTLRACCIGWLHWLAATAAAAATAACFGPQSPAHAVLSRIAVEVRASVPSPIRNQIRLRSNLC